MDEPQGEPRAAFLILHALDPAVERDVMQRLLQHRRIHPHGLQLGGENAERRHQQHGAEDEPQAGRAEEQAKGGGDDHRGEGESGGRLDGEEKIKGDAATEEHRQPEEPAPAFAVERRLETLRPAGRRNRQRPAHAIAGHGASTVRAPDPGQRRFIQ